MLSDDIHNLLTHLLNNVLFHILPEWKASKLQRCQCLSFYQSCQSFLCHTYWVTVFCLRKCEGGSICYAIMSHCRKTVAKGNRKFNSSFKAIRNYDWNKYCVQLLKLHFIRHFCILPFPCLYTAYSAVLNSETIIPRTLVLQINSY